MTSRTDGSSRSAVTEQGASSAVVTESPLANRVTLCPSATISSTRYDTIRSVPPYRRGGTLSMRGAMCAIRMYGVSSCPGSRPRTHGAEVGSLKRANGKWQMERFRPSVRSPFTRSVFGHSALRIGNGGEQGDLRAARIEPRVLHDDRHVGFEHRGVVGVERNRLGILEIVEPQVKRAPRRDDNAVGADRLAIGEEDRHIHVRRALAGIEDARGLVRHQGAI